MAEPEIEIRVEIPSTEFAPFGGEMVLRNLDPEPELKIAIQSADRPCDACGEHGGHLPPDYDCPTKTGPAGGAPNATLRCGSGSATTTAASRAFLA